MSLRQTSIVSLLAGIKLQCTYSKDSVTVRVICVLFCKIAIYGHPVRNTTALQCYRNLYAITSCRAARAHRHNARNVQYIRWATRSPRSSDRGVGRRCRGRSRWAGGGGGTTVDNTIGGSLRRRATIDSTIWNTLGRRATVDSTVWGSLG
jgi:hypothetical protein